MWSGREEWRPHFPTDLRDRAGSWAAGRGSVVGARRHRDRLVRGGGFSGVSRRASRPDKASGRPSGDARRAFRSRLPGTGRHGIGAVFGFEPAIPTCRIVVPNWITVALARVA